MGHHLIILAHNISIYERVHPEVTNESDPETEPAVLIAVDLRDGSIQEARVPAHLFFIIKDTPSPNIKMIRSSSLVVEEIRAWWPSQLSESQSLLSSVRFSKIF